MQALDHVTRRWTDILWTSSEKARDASRAASVKRIYYTIAAAYALMNCARADLQHADGRDAVDRAADPVRDGGVARWSSAVPHAVGQPALPAEGAAAAPWREVGSLSAASSTW